MDEGSGSIVPWSDLRKGGRYEVLLSGGAGFCRYRLSDRVELLSEPPALPSLRFLGRSGLVSDIVGEKLDEAFASEVIASLRQRFAGLRPFCTLAPGKERYLLIATTDGETDLAELAAECDRLLRANYHYAHARNIGQLKPVAAVQSSAEVEALYLEWSGGAGRVLGEVKLPALWINSQLMTQLENL